MSDRDTTEIVRALIAANDSPEFRKSVFAAYRFFSTLDSVLTSTPASPAYEEAVAVAAHYLNKVPAVWLANIGEKQ